MTTGILSPKPEPATSATDLENGDAIELASSTPSEQPDRLEKRTSERQTSHDARHPRFGMRWFCSPRLRRVRKIGGWFKGPPTPEKYYVKPFFKPIQTFPNHTLARLPKAIRYGLFVSTFLLWIVLFGVIISKNSRPINIAGYGAPVRLSCIAQLWPSAPSCGLNGINCLPFDNASFAFSCPAACAAVDVLNPRAIGNQSINYRSLVVGGTPNTSDGEDFIYRGDSFICGAAIHAGVLKDSVGGCGVASVVGQRDFYGSTSRNGIASIGFDSSFPLSLEFDRSEQVMNASGGCQQDPRWDLLALSTVFTAVFGFFTSHPTTFFGTIFVIIYWQIAMASDPPSFSDYPSLASAQLGNFLPAAFIAVLIYQWSIRKTLNGLRAHIEKTVLWVGACWVGALNNLALEKIPLQRLTTHDIHQQPGAITALVIIVIVLAAVAIYQIWCFRNEGRLLRYLGLYAVLGTGLLILISIPSLSLRIHHYILALLLLPGTSLQTRPSLLCQGLLVGLFINGIARWGFASILQTANALRGDAQLGSAIPSVLPPLVNGSSITFAWKGLARGYQGVSVLVNDVERFRSASGEGNFTWVRQALERPEYFRFGFVSFAPFGGLAYSDFTRVGTWLVNGSWVDIPPGRT